MARMAAQLSVDMLFEVEALALASVQLLSSENETFRNTQAHLPGRT